MAAPRRFRESYQNVDSILQSPLADGVILDVIIVVTFDSSPSDELEDSNTISASWSLHLRCVNKIALKLQVGPSGPLSKRSVPAVPAVLTIAEVSPTQSMTDSKNGIPTPITLPVSRRYTVRDFLGFLKDEGLLKYEVSYETHPGYWLFRVVEGLALNNIVPGGSSLKISKQVDAFNRSLAAVREQDVKKMMANVANVQDDDDLPPLLRIDPGVMSNPGSFVKSQDGENVYSSTT